MCKICVVKYIDAQPNTIFLKMLNVLYIAGILYFSECNIDISKNNLAVSQFDNII